MVYTLPVCRKRPSVRARPLPVGTPGDESRRPALVNTTLDLRLISNMKRARDDMQQGVYPSEFIKGGASRM